MTDQPRNITAASAIDEIRMLLGNIPDDEFEQRRRLRLCRTIASHQITLVGSPMARQLLWMVCDVVTPNLYAPMPVDLLTDLAKFCRRLLIVADQANILEPHDELV